MELQHSTMEVIDSSGSEIEINIFDDPAVNEFFIQLFLSSMYEQVTRLCEEGRSEDREAEVNVSPSYISVNPFAFL